MTCRICSSDASSTEANTANPALLTTTSIVPSAANASSTTRLTCAVSVTSRRPTHSRSPWAARRPSSTSGRRRVAATRSPRSRRRSVRPRPKPEDVPVMNQVLVMLFPSFELVSDARS